MTDNPNPVTQPEQNEGPEPLRQPGSAGSDSGALLEARGIGVNFGGVRALDSVDLAARRGELLGLIGPNGAGKTTMLNVISGTVRPQQGEVLFDGNNISRWMPHSRARHGIARTFQRLEVFGRLSVRENLLVAWEAAGTGRALGRQRATGAEVVQGVLDELDLERIATRAAGQLPTGLARLVELGRALCTQPALLLLDEPCSGLGPDETELLRTALRTVIERNRATLGIILVEHHTELVLDVSNRVTVLDFGKVIASGEPREISRDPVVLEAYLGSATLVEAS